MNEIRLAITTTPDAAPRSVAVASKYGLEPIELPCIRIEPSDDATIERLRRASADCDWVVLTSRRAVQLLWPDGSMPHVAVAAVGASTARAVEAAGGRPTVVGSGGSEALIPRLSPSLVGKRIVFPYARAGDGTLLDALRRLSSHVTAEPAYDTIPVAPPTEPEVDAVVFGSPSAVSGWTASRTLDGLTIGAMGPTTAGALDRIGHRPQAVPARPGLRALIAAVAAVAYDTPRSTND